MKKCIARNGDVMELRVCAEPSLPWPIFLEFRSSRTVGVGDSGDAAKLQTEKRYGVLEKNSIKKSKLLLAFHFYCS